MRFFTLFVVFVFISIHVCGQSNPSTSEKFRGEQVYSVVEQPPSFPNSQSDLVKYITENLEYPKVAEERGIEGTVVLQFVVWRDGTIGDFKVLRDIGGGTAAEALRLIKSGPDWIPGKHNGEAVNVRQTVPIKFRLE